MANPPSDTNSGGGGGGGDLALPIIDIPDPEGAGPTDKSIAHKQEDARRFLATALVIIFGLEVLGAMLALWLCASVEHIKDILTVILGPTVALVGSATGFYFGTSPSAGSSKSQ